MAQVIHLSERGVRVFYGRLYNHDYLWFSSNEISKVSMTQPLLHNYALCYALAQKSYRIYIGSIPKYTENWEEEFSTIPVYATPGRAIQISRTAITFNAVDSLTLTTGDSKRLNTPNLGKRVYIDPVWEPLDLKHPEHGYEFYVFTFNDYQLPSVFRLGKKGASVRVRWSEISNPISIFREQPQHPTHIVNPLDITGRLVSYDPISIPPHLLLRSVVLADDWFIFNSRHVVHVPKLVLKRVGCLI